MKIRILLPVLAFLLAFTAQANNFSDPKDPNKDKVLINVLNYMLVRGHFVEKDLNDDFSEKVFESFINGLDPSKRYFTQKDIKEFSSYKYKIDDQIKRSDLSFYNLVYNRFLEKINSAKNYYVKILEKPFNYKKEEELDMNYEKVPFAKNENQLIDYWRKQLKLQTISRIQDEEEVQQNKVKKDKSYKVLSFKEMEKVQREKVLKSMNELYIRIDELEHDDWYSTFLNSVVSAFDPHTTYMPPSIKERFDQDMSGKLEGIGARLQKKGNYTHVVELISGGPAWKKGELEVGDIILKVAQAEEEPLEIIGMKLDDSIKFIKGPKGTEVRLTVKKKIDGSTKVISIIRDVVELEETFVKSSTVIKNKTKYGIINLPRFYIDFNDKNYRDSSKDMEKEILELKKEGVSGLIIDLRNNGGGSLKTAIDIAGLFIKSGPIVQVKYRGEKPQIKKDNNNKIIWDGPLVVLVNELSASASEIFAAAMQDYNRAVIMGSNQTYGKGTVQNVLGLNRFYPDYDKDLGFIKMTIQKFYRVNGGSTQKEGVYSDIAMPSKYSYMEFGERDLDGALAWDRVKQAKYELVNSYSNFSEVVNTSKERINSNKTFQLINDYAKWLKKEQENTTYSLNYKEFVKDLEAKNTYTKKFNSVFDYTSTNTFSSPNYELALLDKDLDLKEKRERWHKILSKDIYVDEALNVLSQLKLRTSMELVKN